VDAGCLCTTCGSPVSCNSGLGKSKRSKQEAEFERKSDAAWEKALPTVLEEAKKGRPYKPWASKPEDLIKSNIPAFPARKAEVCILPVVVEVK
jgi:hypothetical protein